MVTQQPLLFLFLKIFSRFSYSYEIPMRKSFQWFFSRDFGDFPQLKSSVASFRFTELSGSVNYCHKLDKCAYEFIRVILFHVVVVVVRHNQLGVGKSQGICFVTIILQRKEHRINSRCLGISFPQWRYQTIGTGSSFDFLT